jgi:dipicolinate synthase subunit A
MLTEVRKMDETKVVRAWVLGGDRRYGWAAEALRRDGLPVKTWAVPEQPDQAENLEAALTGADLVLLPTNAIQGQDLAVGGQRLPAALLPRFLAKHAQVLGGPAPDDLTDWLASQGVGWHDLMEQPGYVMENAAITAEGAVQVLMGRLSRTVQGANILVMGWGRIGRFLAEKLKALGAAVTVSARREADFAEIAALGMTPDRTGKFALGLGQYDAVCNTVPHLVISEPQLETIQGICLELASPPGGFPPSDRVLLARGLPGKTAPETAGEALAKAVWACLAGEGRTLE